MSKEEMLNSVEIEMIKDMVKFDDNILKKMSLTMVLWKVQEELKLFLQ